MTYVKVLWSIVFIPIAFIFLAVVVSYYQGQEFYEELFEKRKNVKVD